MGSWTYFFGAICYSSCALEKGTLIMNLGRKCLVGLTSVSAFASLLFISAMPASAAAVKYSKETELSFPAKSKFKVSAGWSCDSATQKLVTPENDLTIYLRTSPFVKGNALALSQSAWKTAKKDFKLKVFVANSPPARDGWEEIHQVEYDVPARENRVVLSIIRVFKGTAYIMLIDGAKAAVDKRGAQIQIVADTWRPFDMKKEDLSARKPKKFTEQDERAMDDFVTDALRRLDIPGAAIAILQDGKIVYRKGFGVKKLGAPDKVTPETLFMIGSTTKPLTTLMLSKLVEQGKLSWDAPVKKALPDFALSDSDITTKVLVKHTACACTGMPRRDMEEVFGSKITSLEDTLAQLRTMKPTSGFGETFQYSNQLVAVGGLTGANVYGKGNDLFSKYENAMNDLVFKPLQMSSTRVRPKESDQNNMASPHAANYDNKTEPFPLSVEDMLYVIAPAGSIWSNIDDLSKYVMMELANGKNENGQQLFSAEQLQKRRTPGVKVDDDTRYGLGLFIENDKGATIVHHAGNTMGFTSHMLFLPGKGVGMAILTNAGGANAFRKAARQKLLEIFLAAKPAAAEIVTFAVKSRQELNNKQKERVSIKPADLAWIADYVGRYESKDLGPVEIKSEAGGRFLLRTPRWQSELGSEKEPGGEKLLALTSPPWWMGELRVVKSPVRKLILDDAQVKYEFQQTAR